MLSTENSNDLDSIKKILVVQFRPFGDVLLATSYLGAIKDKFPNASVDFLVKKPFDEVLYKNPWLSQIIVFEEKSGISYLAERLKLFRYIRRRRYDLIIDQQSGTGSGQVAFFSKARFKLGWAGGKWNIVYNLKAEKGIVRYRASQNFDMLKPLGIHERPHQLFYHVKPASMDYAKAWLERKGLTPDETLLISPGSPRTRKKWDSKNFSILIDHIVSKTRMKVIVLWGPDEYKDANEVVNHCRKPCLLAPSTDYNQAAAFLKHCRLLICNDGGLNHLSVALGVPSLAVFGNTSPEKWSAQGYSPGHYHLCNPKWKRASNNHFGITPKEMFQKVIAILEEV